MCSTDRCEGWPTTLELNTNNLESGMYQVRVSFEGLRDDEEVACY